MRPATAHDLLELRTARPAAGQLVHQDCGSRVVWTLLVDAAHCLGCGAQWTYPFLLDRDNPKREPELYKWVPPIEVHDESAR